MKLTWNLFTCVEHVLEFAAVVSFSGTVSAMNSNMNNKADLFSAIWAAAFAAPRQA